MLMKGDLVRIPQNTYIETARAQAGAALTKRPAIGIVLSVNEFKCKVLLDDREWLVKSKDLQLCGREEC